ncbi:MAG: Hsp33 family molecular chaperone HslO [Desulfotignum sp.]|nr:Hsp33 family molecular chaperone HslO [Desulfotignum sp.]
MIKKDIFNHDIKARFKATSKDRIYRFIMADKKIKGAVVHATLMVNEMKASHELGPVETLILGQAYIAGALLCTTLKGDDRISLNIECSGPVKGLDVEANGYGEVRGFLKTRQIIVSDPARVQSLSSLFGAGFLTVTRYLEGSGHPYSSRIHLAHGTIAEDLAAYFLESEQISTAVNLSVVFDDHQQVTGAGGIFLQAMPGADSESVAVAENMLRQIEPPGQFFARGKSAENMIMDTFAPLSPRLLGQFRVAFFCRCSRKRMQRHLKNLSSDVQADILENGPFPLEIRCHHCNSVYRFTREDLCRILDGS